MGGREELRAESRQVRAFGAEMVVDDVDEDGDAESVRAIDERAQILGAAVRARWRKERRTVVTPVAATREIRQRHQLDRGDAQITEIGEALGHARKRA